MIVAADRDEAAVLLAANELPTDDLADPSITLYGVRDAALVGVIGLQRCGHVGLLRSLAVAESHRGTGLARRLCEHVFEVARAEQIAPLYLITTSAAEYFRRHGFEAIDRASAPATIQATPQFASLCPASAIVMRLNLPVRA